MVLPSYKLPESLETIRSARLSQGKSFLFPSRRVQLGRVERERESPLVLTALARGGETRGRGRAQTPEDGESVPNKVALDPSLQTYWSLRGNSPGTLHSLAAVAGWSRAPPPHLWDGPCLHPWSTTPFQDRLQASSCTDIIGAWLPTPAQTEGWDCSPKARRATSVSVASLLPQLRRVK